MNTNPDFAQVEWMVEGGTPNTLLRAGIDRNSLMKGTEIVVRGYQSKDKACTPICKANGRDVTFPDGRKLFMGSSGTGAPKEGADKSERPRSGRFRRRGGLAAPSFFACSSAPTETRPARHRMTGWATGEIPIIPRCNGCVTA